MSAMMTLADRNRVISRAVPVHVVRQLNRAAYASTVHVLERVTSLAEFAQLGTVEVRVVPLVVKYTTKMGDLNLDYLYPGWAKISTPFSARPRMINVYVSPDGRIRNSSGPESSLSVG